MKSRSRDGLAAKGLLHHVWIGNELGLAGRPIRWLHLGTNIISNEDNHILHQGSYVS